MKPTNYFDFLLIFYENIIILLEIYEMIRIQL